MGCLTHKVHCRGFHLELVMHDIAVICRPDICYDSQPAWYKYDVCVCVCVCTSLCIRCWLQAGALAGCLNLLITCHSTRHTCHLGALNKLKRSKLWLTITLIMKHVCMCLSTVQSQLYFQLYTLLTASIWAERQDVVSNHNSSSCIRGASQYFFYHCGFTMAL